MQVTHSDVKSNKLLTVLAVYICVFYPLCDFGATYIMGWAVLLGFWLLQAVSKQGRLYLTKFRLRYVWIAVVVMIYFIMPNARNDVRATQALMVNMFFCVLYLMSAQIDRYEILRVMKIFIIAGIAFSVFIIFCRIFPNVYLDVIIPRLRGVDANEIRRFFKGGYGAQIAGSITYSSYVISMASFFCLGDLFCGTKLLSKRKVVIYELVFITAVLCEGRRGELLCLVAALVIIYLISTPFDSKKVLTRAGVLIAMLFVGCFLLVILVRHGYLKRFVDTGSLLQGGLTEHNLNRLTSGRFYLWKNAWQLFLKSPVFGIGWSSFSENVVTTVNNVHNCYLQFLCETGIVGFAAIVLPMFITLAGSIKWLKLWVRKIKETEFLSGNAIVVSTGMQLFFLMLYLMDPVFYKGYYHMILIILILFYEYSLKNGWDYYTVR